MMIPKWVTPKATLTVLALVVTALIWLGASALGPGDRLTALEGRMGSTESDVRDMRTLLEAVSRDRCLENYERAQLAGFPCRKLVDRPVQSGP